MYFELKEDEELLADVAANLMRGWEGVGGRLRVTNRRLLFEAHAFNLQRMPCEVPRSQIAEVKAVNSLGIIPNGLLVVTHSGLKYRFVVNGRRRLLKLLS